MKKIASLALAALTVPSAALAHPGDHHGFEALASLRHLLSEPDHLFALAALAALAGLGVLTYVRRRASR